ncbi:MAG: cytochrome c peroxidase [Planctomycetota bacterium]
MSHTTAIDGAADTQWGAGQPTTAVPDTTWWGERQAEAVASAALPTTGSPTELGAEVTRAEVTGADTRAGVTDAEVTRATVAGAGAEAAAPEPEEGATFAPFESLALAPTDADATSWEKAGWDKAAPAGSPRPARRSPVCPACLQRVETRSGGPRCGCDLEEPGLRIGARFAGYVLLERIGVGGMGIVFRARQVRPEREVALKVMRFAGPRASTARRRFLQEADAAARLSHPGIVRVHEVGEVDGQPFYSMELLEGLPLDEHARAARLDERGIAELVASVADAVEHLHQRGIVHRDLKPDNVLVGPQGARIIDFGIAKWLEGGQATQATRTGEVLGTLRYMAPEQAAGRQDLDPRADVYALGAILYELLAGQAPWKDLRNRELLDAIEHLEPTPPAGVAADLLTILGRAMAKEPRYRYASAAALRDDLRRFLAGEPVLARPPSITYRLRKRFARHRSALVSLAAIAIAAGTVSWHLREEERLEAELRREQAQLEEDERLARERGLRRSRPRSSEPLRLARRALSDFGQLPPSVPRPRDPITPAQVALGRQLFWDPRLSSTGQVSCATCHPLDQAGADGLPRSLGVSGQRGARNAPSVLNAALHERQLADGRAQDVEEQAGLPLLHQGEMGMAGAAEVEAALGEVPGYVASFAAAFPGEARPLSFRNVGRAIGAFERQLLTPGRLDAFAGGADPTALSGREQEGLRLFFELGCASCHVGPAVGGSMFQKLGLLEDLPGEDQGRFEVTGLESDRRVFKVASLRNVARTGPYLHDGSVETLVEAVTLMARYQLDLDLSDAQVDALVDFLRALDGELDPALAARPALPAGPGLK